MVIPIIGINSSRAGDENAQQQTFKEILRIVQGTSVDVSRLVDSGISLNEAGIDLPEDEGQEKQSESSSGYLDTSNMFFVCFGPQLRPKMIKRSLFILLGLQTGQKVTNN